MNKREYLRRLSNHLDKLPQNEYEDVMDHFEEYFEEAGPDGEEDLIKELGSPREVATEILTKMLEDKEIDGSVRKKKKKSKKEKGFFRYLTLAVLVIFAAPIGIPLTFALMLSIIAIVAVVVALLFSAGAFAIMGFFIGVKLFFVGVIMLFSSPPSSAILLGSGLVVLSGTIILLLLTKYIYKISIIGVKKIARYASQKRGGKNE